MWGLGLEVWEWLQGNGTPLQYSCLENPMDGGAWWATVHGVAKSRTRLSDFTFTFNFHALEKEMATHSSVLAWRIPGTGEPGGLPSLGSHRVGHDWSDLAAAAAARVTTSIFKNTNLYYTTQWKTRKAPKIKFGHITLKASALNTSSLWNFSTSCLPASYSLPKPPVLIIIH